MKIYKGGSSWLVLVALGLTALAVSAGCSATTEPNAVMSIGARNLRCRQSELETALHRESARVREYYVGCDFMYTRVLCDKPDGASNQPAGCHPAKPQPPSLAGARFKEDPVTFEWELDTTLASTEAAPRAEDLFSSP